MNDVLSAVCTRHLAVVCLGWLVLFPAYIAAAPPVITNACGGDGEPLCADDLKVDAIRVGKAEMWGCQGKNLYFTPHHGGECWSCPDDFKRTLKPIHSDDACKRRGSGESAHTSATFVRSAYGCPAGQYHKGLSCYRCPAGSEKITFLGAFNPGKSCRVLTCQDGLRVTPRPPKTLQGIGPEYTPVCGEHIDLPAFIKDIARERIAKTPAFNDAVKEFLKALYQDQGLRAALRNKDWARALYMIRSMPQYQVLKQNAVQYGYASMSLGVVADVQVIGGANQEAGIAVDWDDRVYTYQTSGLSLGIALGGDVGFNLGFWTVPASQLGGYAQGTTFSVSGGLAPGLGVSLGAGTWISYYPYEFLGVTWTLGGGAGAELGEYNEVVTTNLRPLTN